MLNNILIVWNVILTSVVILLFMQNSYAGPTNYDTVQNTILCGYITDLQIQTGADRLLSPDCEGDIEKIHTVISN